MAMSYLLLLRRAGALVGRRHGLRLGRLLFVFLLFVVLFLVGGDLGLGLLVDLVGELLVLALLGLCALFGLLRLAPLAAAGAPLLDDLALLDAAGPGARRLVAHLDEGLEAHEVGLQRTPGQPHPRGGLLEEPLRLEVHVHLDARQCLAELVERHDAHDVRPTLAAPGDPPARGLLGDLRLP